MAKKARSTAANRRSIQPYFVETVLAVKKYKIGYEVRTISVQPAEKGANPFEIRTAFTAKGFYIGSPRWAYRLYRKYGIVPELASKKHNVCSIGYCAARKSWYGWSHRAMCEFKKGDRVFEEGFGTDKTPFVKHGKRVIQTNADAKLAATRFAKSVS